MKIETFGRISVAHAKANAQESMKFAKARSGKLLSESDVIAETNRSPELTRALGARGLFFWLDGQGGTELAKHLRIDNARNALVRVAGEDDRERLTAWKKLPFHERAYARAGKGPRFMVVYLPDAFDARLYLWGDGCDTYAAPVVVYKTSGPGGAAGQKGEASQGEGTATGERAPATAKPEAGARGAAEKIGLWRRATALLRKR